MCSLISQRKSLHPTRKQRNNFNNSGINNNNESVKKLLQKDTLGVTETLSHTHVKLEALQNTKVAVAQYSTAGTQNFSDEETESPDRSFKTLSPELDSNKFSSTINIISNNDPSRPLNEPNCLQLLQKHAQDFLESASQSICSNNFTESLHLTSNQLPSERTTDNDFRSKHRCRYCGKILSSDSALQIHLRSHTGERPFICNLCDSKFTTKGNLKVHAQRHSQILPYIPMNSFAMYPYENPIQSETFQNQNMSVFNQAAPVIDISDDQEMPLDLSMKSDTNSEIEFSEWKMNKTNRDNQVEGGKNKSDIAKLVDFCKTPQFRLNVNMVKHSNGDDLSDTVSSVSTINAEDASSTISNESLFYRDEVPLNLSVMGPKHVLQKQIVPDPIFSNCSEQQEIITNNRQQSINYPVMSSLLGNFRLPGHFGYTTCNLCFKTFACYSALETHIRSHTKEKPFRCSECHRGFSTKGNMRQHSITHKQQQILPISDLKTSTGSAEDRNLISEETSRASSESIIDETEQASITSCSPSRTTDYDLSNPLPIQAKYYPTNDSEIAINPKHWCAICRKNFSSSSALQIHMRTHTGDKPFRCGVCQKAFTTKGNLKVHMGTHMWTNPTSRRGRRMSLELSPNATFPLEANCNDRIHFRSNEFLPPYFPPYLTGIRHNMNTIGRSSMYDRNPKTPPNLGSNYMGYFRFGMLPASPYSDLLNMEYKQNGHYTDSSLLQRQSNEAAE